jgi:hypothetical protein
MQKFCASQKYQIKLKLQVLSSEQLLEGSIKWQIDDLAG